MEEFAQTSPDIRSELIDEIVCKVKSEGLFDQFRRECLADVDTKPAYQNLQHRVESSVSSFLGEQPWTPQLNKNQLREKLRKLITEKGFFEAGIERIVDQVVNPKLNSNLVPKIEDVAYKFLGVEKPSFNIKLELTVDEHETSLPNLDLEQVSPESSEKSPSIESKSPAMMATNIEYLIHEECEERVDDLESPAFEPLTASPNFQFKQESFEKEDDDMDISDGDDDGPLQMNGSALVPNDEVKSNLSSISGLTSNDSNNDGTNGIENQIKIEIDEIEEIETAKYEYIEQSDVVEVEKNMMRIENCIAPEITFDTAEKLPQSENIISNTSELIVDNINQDSVLSQVSSTSRLSIVTNNNTNTRMNEDADDSNQMQIVIDNSPHIVREQCPYDISEEAQMQKFNESSSSSNNLFIDTDNMSNGTNQYDKKEELITSFDIKREEIKFEGTERKSFDLSSNDSNEDKLKIENDSSNDNYSMATHLVENIKQEIKTQLLTELKSEINEFESTNSELKSEFNSNCTSNDEKPIMADTDDSKDKNSDSKSSLNRNGNDSDSSKHRSKDRSHFSSSKHRSHSDRNKDRKSHPSSHSSSKDKTKTLKEENDSKNGSNKHRSSNSSSSSKHKHHKSDSSRSSSSSSIRKIKDNRNDKSNSEKDSPSSDSGAIVKKPINEISPITAKLCKKDHSRHSSSSSSTTSQRDKHRSASKKDDHSIYKEKFSLRQRSRSKDSNDGSTHLQFGSQNVFSGAENANTNQSSSNNQSTGKCSNETQAITSHSIDHSSINESKKNSLYSDTIEMEMQQITSTQAEDKDDDEFVLPSQPVVVDQILAGNDLNLKLFIGENRNNPIVSSIEQSLECTEVKKPKVAANIFEARKLSKLRKEIERNKQKKLELAAVLAKQYIRANASTVRDDSSQGVELEFVCMNSGKQSIGPIISSPAKYKNGIVEKKCLTPTATITSSSLAAEHKIEDAAKMSNENEADSQQQIKMPDIDIDIDNDVDVDDGGDVVVGDDDDDDGDDDDDDDDEFNETKIHGFDVTTLDSAKLRYHTLLESLKTMIKKLPTKNRSKIFPKKLNNSVNAIDEFNQELLDLLNTDNQQLFMENNKLNESTSKAINRKRKIDNSMAQQSPNASKIPATNDSGMILASVFISQTSTTECNVKPDSSTRPDTEPLSALEKQRQKTRYSNDDLFKPRPVLGGISRSRRRGLNCNE